MLLLPFPFVQMHPAERSSGEAEPGAEGGAGDEPMPPSQSGSASGPVSGGGAQRKGDR